MGNFYIFSKAAPGYTTFSLSHVSTKLSAPELLCTNKIQVEMSNSPAALTNYFTLFFPFRSPPHPTPLQRLAPSHLFLFLSVSALLTFLIISMLKNKQTTTHFLDFFTHNYVFTTAGELHVEEVCCFTMSVCVTIPSEPDL